MPNAAIVYNGFVFPGNASYEVTERYEYDESETTVTGTVFLIRAKAFLAAESSSSDHSSSSFHAGPVVHNARQLLSKAGGTLKFEHDGFGPSPQHIEINGYAEPVEEGDEPQAMTVRDSNNGPKPRILQWMPVGNTACAEIVWECETTIPICDGGTAPNFTGVKAFNYSIQYDIDESGYTTRRISGYIEIAMTRDANRGIQDSVDFYRNKVQFQKPNNFSRTVSWSVSANKRRADFSIVDTEKKTSNPFPPSVIDIQARHRVGWSRQGGITTIPSTISASITLSPLTPRLQAWLIFRAILQNRLASAAGNDRSTFLDSLEIEEELFANRFSFSATYRILNSLGVSDMIGATGLFQPLGNTWGNWHNSTAILNPFQDWNSDYGLANLMHDPSDDKIIYLCDNAPTYQRSPGYSLFNTSSSISPFYNSTPSPDKSWLRFQARFEYEEGSQSSEAVTLGPDDLVHDEFDPAKPDATLPTPTSNSIERWVEHYAGDITIWWVGGAQRVGYKITRPGKLQIGDELLVPTNASKKRKAFFSNEPHGFYFGQKVYQAFWRIPYKVKKRPPEVGGDAAIPSGLGGFGV